MRRISQTRFDAERPRNLETKIANGFLSVFEGLTKFGFGLGEGLIGRNATIDGERGSIRNGILFIAFGSEEDAADGSEETFRRFKTLLERL